MLAKLFVFTKALNWSVLASAVTFGGLVVSQQIDIPDAAPAPIEEAEYGTLPAEPDSQAAVFADNSRDSAFAVSLDAPAPNEPQPIAAPLQTLSTLAAQTGSYIAANDDMLLNAAAETGCRLFHRIASATTDQDVQTASGTQELECDGIESGDFVPDDCQLTDGSGSFNAAPMTSGGSDAACCNAAECQSESKGGEVYGNTASSSTGTCSSECDSADTCDSTPCDVAQCATTQCSAAECSSTAECPSDRRCQNSATCGEIQTCQLKNRKTNQTLATLAISSPNTTQLTPEEIAELAPSFASEFDVTPMLRVVQNEYTQAWEIEARNIELAELVEQLANYCPHPIVCGPDVRGTVSANVSAYSIDEALHRLVAPFGIKIGRSEVGIVVGTPYQSVIDVHADYETTAVASSEPAPAELDRLPPVQPELATEMTHVQPVSLIQKSTQVVIDESELKVANTAKQMIGRGDSAAAIQLIASAAGERPNSAFLFRILGEALAFRSEYDGAAVALERSIKLNKYDPLTSQVFSEVLAKMGQSRRAEHYAQQARDIASGIVTAP